MQQYESKVATNPTSTSKISVCLESQAKCLLKLNRWNEAEAAAHKSLALRKRTLPEEIRTGSVKSLLGECLVSQQKFADAEPLLLRATRA